MGVLADIRAAWPGQAYNLSKVTDTSATTGFLHSLWTIGGSPAAGAAAGSANGAICTNTTTGAIPFVNAPGGQSLYLAKVQIGGTLRNTIHLYDRLWHNSGLDATNTGVQSFTQPALTRYTNGVGVEMYLEVYTALGATPATITATYTNQAGSGSRTATYLTAANHGIRRNGLFELQSGDTGVQSVQSVQLSGSTGSVGNFGITLMRRIASFDINLGEFANVYEALDLGLPKIENDACLFFTGVTLNDTATLQMTMHFVSV